MSHKKLIYAVESDDSQAFLIHYFEIIQSGLDLPIPSGLEADRIRKGWAKICQEIVQSEASDAFIDALTTRWQAVITKQGGAITSDFVPKILALLEDKPYVPHDNAHRSRPKPLGGPKPTLLSAKKVYPRLSKPVPESTPTTLPPLGADEVGTSISDSYRETERKQIAKEINSDEKREVLSESDYIKIKKALYTYYNQNAIKPFLIAYFKLSRHTALYKLPALTGDGVAAFYSQWRTIIMTCFKVPANDAFLHALHTVWHKLYQQTRCLPTTEPGYTTWLDLLDTPEETHWYKRLIKALFG